jgi:protein N-terminal methyltransferase
MLNLKGRDSTGKRYDSLQKLWEEEFGNEASKETNPQRERWYKHGVDYWTAVPATVDGVLGGFGFVTDADLKASKEFLQQLPGLQFRRAADCGAGIGRVTRGLFVPLFQAVEAVEPCLHYAKAISDSKEPRIEKVHAIGMQQFNPEPGTYDIIWAQWTLGHLPDDDFVSFLKRCAIGLTPTGYFCAKENTCAGLKFMMDRGDGAITRSDPHFKYLFQQAGMVVVSEQLQPNFPEELHPVRTYALRPKSETKPKAAESTTQTATKSA